MLKRYKVYFEDGDFLVYKGQSKWEAAAKCLAEHPDKSIMKVEVC